MNDPEVSVVMPVYNAERFVAEAVQSILSQTFEDFEFLIFDDGSTDRSLEILQQYAGRDERIRLFAKPHTGYVTWLNEGLVMARGKFLARMDADDISLPERFARQVEYLRLNPDCVAVGCDLLLIDPDGAPICTSTHDYDHDTIEADLLGGGHGVIAHPASMMRRDSVISIGGYRKEFETIEDFDLWLRLAERGHLANLPEVLFKYRQHHSSVIFTQAERQQRSADVIITEARLRRGLQPLSHSVWDHIPPTIADSHRIWARWAASSGNRETAIKHAFASIHRDPFSFYSWNVLCRVILPNRLKRILKKVFR